MSLNLFRPYFKVLIEIVGYSGFLGATYSISIISDIISLLTLHVYSFYVASARLYHWQLVILQSLFHLFRGKRRNVLRKRIDSCNYELDQLLMGTIFFIVLIFLLPTMLVFYLSFATTRLAIVLVCALLESALTCLNHFPLFAILLRIKDSKRIPGGIRLVYEKDNKKWNQSYSLKRIFLKNCSAEVQDHRQRETFVLLKPIPLTVAQMFHQYLILSGKIRMHYLSFGVVKRLLTGQFVSIQRRKLYGLLYSMLPEQRIGIQLMYQQLQELL